MQEKDEECVRGLRHVVSGGGGGGGGRGGGGGGGALTGRDAIGMTLRGHAGFQLPAASRRPSATPFESDRPRGRDARSGSSGDDPGCRFRRGWPKVLVVSLRFCSKRSLP